MTAAARSLLVFGVYLLGLGALLVIAPNVALGLIGIAPTSEVWARVVGMLVALLGWYYLQAARAGLTAFFRWTVTARALVIVFFTAFVLLGLAPPALLIVGLTDLAGAGWTLWALRRGGA